MIYFVVNPRSGNGKGIRVWNHLEEILVRQNVVYDKIITQHAGHTSEWCRSFVELADGAASSVSLIVVGGDGTLNEAIQGIMEASSGKPVGDWLRLSFIPAGSGNDFARGHGITLEPEIALQQLLTAMASDRKLRIDVLKANGKFAISSFGAGLDGEVAYTANHAPYKQWMNRIGLGYAAYILSLLRVLVSYEPKDMELTIDGKTEKLKRVWLAAFSNVPVYGGGMYINPTAKANDGYAEICVVHDLSRLGLLQAFPKVYSGKHVGHKGVRFFRGKNISIESAGSIRIHADGENAGNTPAKITVIPQSIQIFY